MSADMRSLIDELGAAAMDCRGLLADVRTATKELRAAIREANETRDQLATAVHDMVNADIDEAVTEQVAKMAEATGQAQRKAVQAVFARFDAISNVLLAGDTRKDRSDGGIDLRKLGGGRP